MNKRICVHGHFYQPPRENPWLEAVEMQESASPYHDWNERITYECYAPNARARLLDGKGRIENIVSNYSRMSFNFGPTVLSWMKEKQPEIHQAIVEADQKSRERFSGHGSAVAQVYNHMILPLANTRDKHTQVIWGIKDFEFRFGRKPEGMWLAETAADDETLDVLAAHDIKFTILSPYQARRVRSLDKDAPWQDANGAHVDPSIPYTVKLPSGRSIAVFFYDAPIAQAVAFEKLLSNGEKFYNRLMGGYDGNRPDSQLVNIATDGESYGHHFQFGDMALAFALHQIEKREDIKLSVYGEFLESNPPTHEAEIHQGSAWSCSHGVERWKSDCGCNSGGHGDWNQKWRGPLREAFDWLRDKLAVIFEDKGRGLFKDPWQARDEYISVILNRSPENVAAFFAAQAASPLNDSEKATAVSLLEMQRHALLMYTSCGWFFDELSGLETTQVILYAARALQLASLAGGENLEAGFLEILEKAKSNIPENANGRVIYEKFIKPAIMTRETAAAHYAISSLFETYPENAHIYSFAAHQEDRKMFTAGNARLAVGRVKLDFRIIGNSDEVTYAVAHLGDHNVTCGVKQNFDAAAYEKMAGELQAAFERADFAELIRAIDRYFGTPSYSIKNLFRDEQYKVLNQILATTREEIYNTYHLLTARYAPLTNFLKDLHVPPLKSLAPALDFVLNTELRKQFENGHLDAERIKSLITEARSNKVKLQTDMLSFAVKGHLDRLSDELFKSPDDMNVLQRFADSTTLLPMLPFGINLWKPQNIYDQLLSRIAPEMEKRGDEKSKLWLKTFSALGQQLGFHEQSK